MKFNKLVWAVVGAVVLFLKNALSDGLSYPEQITIGALVLGAVGTWLIPNTPLLATAKTWVNALAAGIGLLAVLAGDGLVGDDWLDALILILTTAGVYVFPNERKVVKVPPRYATD